MLNRRVFLLLMMTSLAAGMAAARPQTAFAKDSGKGSGGDGGGDNDGGGDDGGGDDGKDDNDRDDNDRDDNDRDDNDRDDNDRDDDDRDDDDKGDDSKEAGDKIRAAVKRGEAESLGSILPAVRRKYPGKVVRIQLAGKGSRLTYRIRLINRDNKLIEIRVNARSGKIMGVYNL